MSDDYWDCPCCERPMPPENDKECHCGKKTSHHLSVSAMCRIMHNMSGRDAALTVEKDKLAKQLAAERAIADRLAGELKELLYYDLQDVDLGRLKSSRDALAAWKEARSE